MGLTDIARRAEVALWRVVVPLQHRHSAAYGSSTRRDVVLVEVRSVDGTVGWGECPTFDTPGYVTETTDAAWSSLRDLYVPEFLESGRVAEFTSGPIDESDGSTMSESGRPTAASAALADARLDNSLRARGIALVDQIGSQRRPLERTAVIAAVGESEDAIARRGVEAVDRGARMVKVKIAPGADTGVLSRLVEVIGADRVAADANGSYGSAEELADVDSLGLAYIEQPFDAGSTWTTLGSWSTALRTPVALDESIRTADDLEAVAEHRAGRIVSIKPARVGGLVAAAAMVDKAQRLGLAAFVGGMVELGIGRAGALAVASQPGCTWPTDLGSSDQYFEVDITEPLSLDPDGRIVAPIGPGVGRVPIPELLERFAVDHVVLR